MPERHQSNEDSIFARNSLTRSEMKAQWDRNLETAKILIENKLPEEFSLQDFHRALVADGHKCGQDYAKQLLNGVITSTSIITRISGFRLRYRKKPIDT